MSNYYEILGVWRDANEDDIDLAAQALSDHWRGALALNDPAAGDWLQIIEHARKTLIDPEQRAAYDRQLEELPASEEEAVYAAGFPWQPYLCALLAVPVLLAAFILILALIANSASLNDADSFRDALLTTMIVSSAVAFGCGLVVLRIANRGKKERNRLHILAVEGGAGPAERARLEAVSRLSEFTDVAVWVTWGATLVVTVLWVWFAILIGKGR
jgi:NADH:ubiquinone oxidoreductase subunit K